MIFHTLAIDVESNTCLSREVVEIPQGDKNSHQILIKLIQDETFYHIPEGYCAEVSFYDSFDNEIFTSTAAQISNYYRGYVTYVVGERLLRDSGRYVGTLTLFDKTHDRVVSARFILNVVKSNSQGGCGCGCGDQTEVVITRDFYIQLADHLRDQDVHLTEADREILEYIANNKHTFITFDNLADALENDEEVRAALSKVVRDEVTEQLGGIDPQKIIEASETLVTYEGRLQAVEDDVGEVKTALSWDNDSLL